MYPVSSGGMLMTTCRSSSGMVCTRILTDAKAPRMILILGGARSGTTFLAKLFDSHPQVLYRHEPDSIVRNSSIPYLPEVRDVEIFRDQARAYLQALLEARSPKVVGHLPVFRKAYHSEVRQLLHQALAVAGKFAARMPVRNMERRIAIPDLIDSRPRLPVVPVIKSVDSLCRAALFAAAYPEARILHILRHPCGVISSKARGFRDGVLGRGVYLDSLFALEATAGYGLSRADMEARSYEEQEAFQWMVQNDKVFREMKDKSGYRLIRYEDLCLDTAAVITDLFAFTGLSENSQTAGFIRALENRRDGEVSYYSVMRSPKQALYKWQHELDPEQVKRIMAMVSRSEIGIYYDAAD